MFRQALLVAAAASAATAARVDKHEDGNHNRREYQACQQHPARATPGAEPALSLLLMKRGHKTTSFALLSALKVYDLEQVLDCRS